MTPVEITLFNLQAYNTTALKHGLLHINKILFNYKSETLVFFKENLIWNETNDFLQQF